MKAIVCEKFGPPASPYKEIPTPTPKEKEVVVRVKAVV